MNPRYRRLRRELLWLAVGVALMGGVGASIALAGSAGGIRPFFFLVGLGLGIRGVFRTAGETIRLLTGRDFIYRK